VGGTHKTKRNQLPAHWLAAMAVNVTDQKSFRD
jgi:hypothetical protein